MTYPNEIPELAYGILQFDNLETECQEVTEQIRRIGYAVLDSGLSPLRLREVSEEFESTRSHYVRCWGEKRLSGLNELNTVRAILSHGGETFLQLAFNHRLLSVIERLIDGKFILNQQNGVINPPKDSYNQGAWHRDLPYQHYVSSSPLAVNALFCVDDFTQDNGGTFVLPASHKAQAFPSPRYVQSNAIQVEAKAGQFIILDCMMYHAGGYNRTNRERRGINHVYTIPYFKQQIKLPGIVSSEGLSAEQLDLLGFTYQEPSSIQEYFASRDR